MEPTSLAFTAGAWVWEKYGKSVTDRTAGVVKENWNKFRWKEAAEAYRAKTQKLYGTMQIFGMTKPVPLDDIFTDAYMLDKPTAFGRFDIEHLKKFSGEPGVLGNAKRINGLRLVVEKGNLFILGKPGAGKTTFLKYIALKAAEQTIDKVPIFISLKHWADSGLELLPYIAERFDICNFPAAQPFVEELLKSGNSMVLFDGLDEVNQENGQRDKQTRAMNNFIEKYDLTQCLITCRIAASDYSFKPFTYVEIADFTEKQIKQFVGNWFHEDKETRDKFLSEFASEDNKGLRELARAPLLLTLLCLAFNETLTFPQRRVEIYEEAIDALLKKWDSSRRIKRDEIYRKLSLGHKENMLAELAAETFEKNEYFIPQQRLEKLITEYLENVPPHDTNPADGEVILKAIEAQHGIFVERAREVYSFSHLTFQEYFTARSIVANAAKGTLSRLVKNHCMDARWREVFLLTTSLLSDATAFLREFRERVDELLNEDSELIAILSWSQKRAEGIEGEPWLIRPAYLFLDLVNRGHSAADDQLAYPMRLMLKPSSSLMLDLVLAGLLDALLGFGDRESSGEIHEHAIEIANEFGLKELANELGGMSIPEVEEQAGEYLEAERDDYHTAAEVLREITIRYRDIGHEWDLTESQEALLADYLYASTLMKDCLHLATMAPREKDRLLNSLYVAPQKA